MKIQLSIKECTLLVISILAVLFIIIGSIHALIIYAKTGADWVSALIQALGNISGGILGGIVAYIVAKLQIDKALDHEREKDIESSLSKLKVIKEELLDNYCIINTLVPFKVEDSYLVNTLCEDMWKICLKNLIISDHLLKEINSCYRKISILKEIKSEDITDDYLKDISERIKKTVELIDKQISINATISAP